MNAIPKVRHCESQRNPVSMHTVLAWLSIFGFVLLFIMNKAEYKIRMLDWAAGVAAGYVMLLLVIYADALPRRLVMAFLISSAWLIWCVFTTPFIPFVGNHFSTGAMAVLLLGIATVNLHVLMSAKTLLPKVILILGITWILISLIMLVMYVRGHITYEGGAYSGLFGNRNSFAVQTALIVGLVWLYANKGLVRLLVVAAGAIMVLASLSVTGIIALLAVIFSPIYLRASGFRKGVVLTLAFASVVIIYFLAADLRARLDLFAIALVNPDILPMSSSAFLRSWLYINSVQLLLEHPWIGIGVDNARYYLIPPGTGGLMSHSNVFEIALGGGVPALMLHYGPLLWAFVVGAKAHDEARVRLQSLVILYVVAGLTAVLYSSFSGAVLYALVILTALDTVRENRQRQSE